MRTREGMAVARANGRLRRKQPKLTAAQQRHLVELHAAGRHTQGELAALLGVSRSTVQRTLPRAEGQRQRGSTVTGAAGVAS